MKTFQELFECAAQRKGLEALTERLPSAKSHDAVAKTGDDRCLSAMTKVVFSAGFRWKVVEAKWDGFEEAFLRFNPTAVAAFDEATMLSLTSDRRIVRNPQKIRATVENARFVRSVAKEHGSFGRFVADWPGDDIVGLWEHLKKNGARLGGASGPRFLRMIGKDTFIFSADVIKSLTDQGILTGNPSSKTQQGNAQRAFASWHEESGRPLCEISMIVACSVES